MLVLELDPDGGILDSDGADADWFDDVSAVADGVVRAAFFGSPSVTETCFSRRCLPKFEVDPQRIEISVLHMSQRALSLLTTE